MATMHLRHWNSLDPPSPLTRDCIDAARREKRSRTRPFTLPVLPTISPSSGQKTWLSIGEKDGWPFPDTTLQ